VNAKDNGGVGVVAVSEEGPMPPGTRLLRRRPHFFATLSVFRRTKRVEAVPPQASKAMVLSVAEKSGGHAKRANVLSISHGARDRLAADLSAGSTSAFLRPRKVW